MSALLRVAAAALLLLAFAACPGPQGSVDDAGVAPPVEGAADAGVDAGGAGADGGATSSPDAGVADAGVQRIGWGNLQWPPYATVSPGQPLNVYGQVWVDGVTPGAGAAPSLEAAAGFGPVGTDPAGAQWQWVPATFNKDDGNNDEWMAALTGPPSGAFDFAFRYRFEGGPWLYGDRSDGGRAGSDDGFSSTHAGKLAVRVAGGTLRVATLNLHCLNDDPAARLDAAAARLAALEVDVVALQEVCEDPAAGAQVKNSAAYLAAAMSGARPHGHAWEQTHLSFGVTPEGVGLVFALPLAETTVRALPVGDFARKTQIAVLASPVGMVAVATAHLSFRTQDAQARIDQARAIIDALNTYPAAQQLAAAIVAGDLNATPDQQPVAEFTSVGFTDAWAAHAPADPGYTHRSDNPTRRIDYVFFRPGPPGPLQLQSVSREFTQPYSGSSWVSDHIAVVAELAVP